MPFYLNLRPGACHVRDNELRSLHPRAGQAFFVLTNWIESGPGAGGPNLATQLISLDSLIAHLRHKAADWQISHDMLRRRVERLERHRSTGQWGFLFNLVPIQAPQMDLVFVLGFDRAIAENMDLTDNDAEQPREIGRAHV